MWRAAELQEPFSPAIHKPMKMIRGWMQKESERVFARELERARGVDRSELSASLSAVSSMGTWQELRLQQDLSVEKARRALGRSMLALLKSTTKR
jgi:hypothetical protein